MILTNGCSFTECLDLPDQTQSWPQLIAKQLEMPVTNLAIGGGSNDRIMRTTQEFLYTSEKPNLVIIGWTSYTRCELSTYNGQYIRLTPGGSLIEDISLHNNPDVNMLHDLYYRDCYNEYLSLKKLLVNAITLGKLLDSMRIPYVFFNAVDDNHLPAIISGNADELAKSAFEYYAHEPVQFPESIVPSKKKLELLVDTIDASRWLWWPGGTYLNRFEFCAKDTGGHYLEEGNQHMAESLLRFL